MWFLIAIGIILVISGWVLGSGFIDLPNVDEKGLAGTLNAIGWLLIIVGIVLTILILVGVLGGALAVGMRD